MGLKSMFFRFKRIVIDAEPDSRLLIFNWHQKFNPLARGFASCDMHSWIFQVSDYDAAAFRFHI